MRYENKSLITTVNRSQRGWGGGGGGPWSALNTLIKEKPGAQNEILKSPGALNSFGTLSESSRKRTPSGRENGVCN